MDENNKFKPPTNGHRFRVTVELMMDVTNRGDVDTQLHYALGEDPSDGFVSEILVARDAIESYRVVSAEEVLPPTEVRWIVTEGNDPDVCEDGEFGVLIDGVAYLYYKHPDPSPCGPDVKYRVINKREFGEVIRRKGDE
jgi:hypothetical protein